MRREKEPANDLEKSETRVVGLLRYTYMFAEYIYIYT